MINAPLYTPQILRLATGLGAFPFRDEPPYQQQGRARSRNCGSSIVLGFDCDATGRIVAMGMQAQACAIGQAAACLFASHAIGADRQMITTAAEQIAHWLAEPDGNMPDWPELAAIAAARSYPARHGAILLAWQAAVSAFSDQPV